MSCTRATPGQWAESDVVGIGEHEFESDEILPDPKVVCETYGEFDGRNAVLICRSLTGSQHVAGHDTESGVPGQARARRGDVVGPGKTIDTNDYYIIRVSVPGSCYGTSGPASEGLDDKSWSTDFLPVTVHD